MKKIVHVGYSHPFNDGRIVRKECKSILKRGDCEVVYITSDKAGATTEEEINGVKIVQISVDKSSKMKLFSYINTLKHKLINLNADVYHIHESELLPIIPFLKRSNRCVIYDMHEDTRGDWQMHFSKYSKIIGSIAGWIVDKYEKKIIKKCDAFIYVTPQFEKQNINCIPCALIPNFPIVEKEKMVSISRKDYCTRSNNICFAGGISDTWSHKTIINAFKSIGGDQYLLAGNSTQVYIETLSKLDGWERVKFYGKVPFDKVQEIYSQSRIGMALLAYVLSDNINGTLGNTKIYEFMQAGLPFICTDFKIWRKIVEKYHCGICSGQLREAIIHLLENEDEAYQMGQNGVKAVLEEYNWDSCEKKLLEIYDYILEGRNE